MQPHRKLVSTDMGANKKTPSSRERKQLQEIEEYKSRQSSKKSNRQRFNSSLNPST